MTGPEHYRNAERHLQAASEDDGPEVEAYHLKSAHVHAMLAVAAATVESSPDAPSAAWLDLVRPNWRDS